MINFSALPSFNKSLKQLSKRFHNIKNDMTDLMMTLQENPENGIFIKKEIYKIRLKNSDTKSGKSGGYRVLYYYLNCQDEIIFFSIFSKTDTENISDNDIDNLIKEYTTFTCSHGLRGNTYMPEAWNYMHSNAEHWSEEKNKQIYSR